MDKAIFSLLDSLEDRHWWFVARRSILIRLIGALDAIERVKLVVDAGCGTGGIVAALTPRMPCIGIDPSQDAIALAQSRFPQCRYVCAELPDALRALDAPADIVLLLDVLEHIDDDRGFLQKLVQSMRPGATLIVTVPARKALWSPQDERVGHRRRYESPDLRALWDGLPVSALRVSYFNRRLYPAVRLVRFVGSLTGRAAGVAGTDFALPFPMMNNALRRIFEGESGRLERYLVHGAARPFAYGASLIAVARRA